MSDTLIIKFLILFVILTLPVHAWSEDFPLILESTGITESGSPEIWCETIRDLDSGKNWIIYRGGDKPVDILMNRDSLISIIRVTGKGKFHSVPENYTTLEDIDWVSSDKFGKNMHRDRVFPKIFRSRGSKRWFFSLEKNQKSRISFDDSGRYVNGSSSGGIIIIHDHIKKHEVVDKWGPPVGGYYRIGLGYWFHNAADPDSRYGYNNTGNLYMRQMAVRTREVILSESEIKGDTIEKINDVSLVNIEESRLISFRTGSDGIPSNKYGDVIESDLKQSIVLPCLDQEGMFYLITLGNSGEVYLTTVNTFMQVKSVDTIRCDDSFYEILKDDEASRNIYKIRKAAVSGFGDTRKIFLSASPWFRIYTSWCGLTSMLFNWDPDKKNIEYRFRNIRNGEISKKRIISLPFDILDYIPDGRNGIYILYIEKAKIDNIDNELDNDIFSVWDGVTNDRSVIPVTKINSVKEDMKKKIGKITIEFTLPVYLNIARVPIVREEHTVSLTPENIRENLCKRIKIGEEKYNRSLELTEKNEWKWQCPSQAESDPFVLTSKYGFIAPCRSLPPVNKGDRYIADILVIGQKTKGLLRFPRKSEISFIMENYPVFDHNGINLKATPSDENGNSLSGGFCNNVVEDSIVYKWEIEKKVNGKYEPVPESIAYQVVDNEVTGAKFDFNSLCLRETELKNLKPGSFTGCSYPFIYSLKTMKSGFYRVRLKVYFDYTDFDLIDDTTPRGDTHMFRYSYRNLKPGKNMLIKLENILEFEIF